MQKHRRTTPFVKVINKAVLEHLTSDGKEVLCRVRRDEWVFSYEVLGARSRHGVLQVNTCDGWKYPESVLLHDPERETFVALWMAKGTK